MCAARVSLRPLVKQQPGHLTYIYICLISSLLTCEHGMLMFSACMLRLYACMWQEQQHESLKEHGADHAMLQT